MTNARAARTNVVPPPGTSRPSYGGHSLAVPAGDPATTISARPGSTLAGLRHDGDDFAAAVFDQAELIGEGGTGMVHAAYQRSLRRTVAVKSLKPSARSHKDIVGLVREAWIAGNLEHPNILPVHLFYSDERGLPKLVMKRIEGASWHQVLYDEETAESFIDGDPLEWHLRVLTLVCHAIHFAHSRGVLHRDLKPDNVMIGRFGEVYVVDWGLAVTLRDDAPPWMPRAADISLIEGTPSYMAPEMARLQAQVLAPTTDVFLLGAVLHELLVRSRRYDGDTVDAVLVQAAECQPFDYGSSVPRELAAIARRATHPDPAKRFADAAGLRLAIEDALRHRGAIRQAEAADAMFAALVADCRAGLADEPTIQGRVLLSRMAFLAAIDTWADNGFAHRRLAALMTWATERAVAAKDLTHAREYISQLVEPPSALVASVDGLAASLAEQERRYDALARDIDPNGFLAQRSRLAFVVGAVWFAWNWTCGFLNREVFPFDIGHLATLLTASYVISLAVLWRVRNTLLTTAFNRSMLSLLTAGLLVGVVTWWGAHALGLSTLQAVAVSGPLYAYGTLVLGMVIDRRTLWTVPVVLVLTILMTYVPQFAFELVGVLGGFLGVAFGMTWRRPARIDNDPAADPSMALRQDPSTASRSPADS